MRLDRKRERHRLALVVSDREQFRAQIVGQSDVGRVAADKEYAAPRAALKLQLTCRRYAHFQIFAFDRIYRDAGICGHICGSPHASVFDDDLAVVEIERAAIFLRPVSAYRHLHARKRHIRLGVVAEHFALYDRVRLLVLPRKRRLARPRQSVLCRRVVMILWIARPKSGVVEVQLLAASFAVDHDGGLAVPYRQRLVPLLRRMRKRHLAHIVLRGNAHSCARRQFDYNSKPRGAQRYRQIGRKNTERPASPSAPYCRFGELGFGKSVIFFRILNTPHRRFIGEGRKIFFIGRHRLSLLAKPAKNANIATIKDISLPPLAFSLSSRFECDNVRHILERFSKKIKKFATLYQKCRIEKIFEICPLTKSFERVRLKMRTAKKEIFLFCSFLQTAVRLL